jgi:hypothetical protein
VMVIAMAALTKGAAIIGVTVATRTVATITVVAIRPEQGGDGRLLTRRRGKFKKGQVTFFGPRSVESQSAQAEPAKESGKNQWAPRESFFEVPIRHLKPALDL